MKNRIAWSVCLFLTLSVTVFAQKPPKPPIGTPIRFNEEGLDPMFPFKVEKGAPQNITNIQTWGKPYSEAGRDGFTRVQTAGFINQAGPQFFLGTNLSGDANFPDEKNAVALAKTLSRFGINAVRLHWMDGYAIWGKNLKTVREFDPEKIDRLDRLIAELEKHGIYINLNLHVALTFGALDGVVWSKNYPHYCKGIDNVDPAMIKAQKKYAKDLLTHVNPYTKRAYINDPGIAMIEINNENSMILEWCAGHFDELPEPMNNYFNKLWNSWLRKKYDDTKTLREKWKSIELPLGENLISNSKPDSNLVKSKSKNQWYIVRDEQTDAELTYDQSGPNGSAAISFTVRKKGYKSWVPQLVYGQFKCKKGQLYTFSCHARADKPTSINVQVGMGHEPWSPVGLNTILNLTTQWQKYEYMFFADTDDEAIRLMIARFDADNQYQFANLSLRKGGRTGLAVSESLEEGSVEPLRINRTSSQAITPDQRADWTLFLKEIEEQYWLDMYHYVKNELKAKQPISGTQLRYGFWYAQGKLDYCDIHGYWNHPRFPNQSWDREDWEIGPEALSSGILSSQATLPELAAVRVLDRPLTVSEYNHPYPNFYAAECMPMLSAFGAFQNWNGIYQYTWSHQPEYDPNQTNMTYFDGCASQGTLVHLPACYAMFVRGDVNRGAVQHEYSVDMSEKQEAELMKDMLKGYHRDMPLLTDRAMTLAVRSGLQLKDLPDSKRTPNVKRVSTWSDLPKSLGSPDRHWIRSETDELLWNFEKDRAYFQVDTPGTRVFSGFVRDREFDFDGLQIKPGKTRLDWATISLVRTEKPQGNDTKKNKRLAPGRYLLAATGLIHNTDAVFVELPNKNISTVHGGKEGKAPFLCEGIPLRLTLTAIDSQRIHCFALDSTGNRKSEINVTAGKSGAVLELGPQYKTLWYEIVIE